MADGYTLNIKDVGSCLHKMHTVETELTTLVNTISESLIGSIDAAWGDQYGQRAASLLVPAANAVVEVVRDLETQDRHLKLGINILKVAEGEAKPYVAETSMRVAAGEPGCNEISEPLFADTTYDIDCDLDAARQCASQLTALVNKARSCESLLTDAAFAINNSGDWAGVAGTNAGLTRLGTKALPQALDKLEGVAKKMKQALEAIEKAEESIRNSTDTDRVFQISQDNANMSTW